MQIQIPIIQIPHRDVLNELISMVETRLDELEKSEDSDKVKKKKHAVKYLEQQLNHIRENTSPITDIEVEHLSTDTQPKPPIIPDADRTGRSTESPGADGGASTASSP